jgi:hypothetical protein
VNVPSYRMRDAESMTPRAILAGGQTVRPDGSYAISFAFAVVTLLGASLVSFGIAERRYSVRYITPTPSAADD